MPCRRVASVPTLLLAAGCMAAPDRAARTAAPDTLVVFAAASLAAPMRALTDSFAQRGGVVVEREHGASLPLARRITELHRVPDVIVLADEEVFPALLTPAHASWYARVARNRMVVAYTDRSRHAAEMSPSTWWQVLLRHDVLVGRADPAVAPAGYRALLTFQLAERFYRSPGLAARLASRTPDRLLRGDAADLAALLEAGELDYVVEYESLARSHHLRFVSLPPEIDLGDPARAAWYAGDSVRVRRGRDSVTVRGAPIIYGASVPRAAPHPAVGERFMALLLGERGRALMRAHDVDMLARPALVGEGVPSSVRAAVAP